MSRQSASKMGKTKRRGPAPDLTAPADSTPTVHGSSSNTRSDLLLAGQSRVLELLAKGARLDTLLAELVRTIEQCSPEMLCSVLLYDSVNQCLRHGAAPSLPDEYNTAVDGISIGPAAGSCGTAIFRRDRVIVEDIATDPLWADYRDLGRKHNLRACWSQPVWSSSGEILGTFASYYRSPRRPTADELDTIERAADLAGVAIERTQADKALRQSEERFRQLAESVRLIPWEADLHSWQFTYVGPQAVEILGYPLDSWYVEGFWLAHVHPEDRERVRTYCLEHSETDDHYDFEYRMTSANGRTIWLHDVVRVLRGSGRDLLRGFMIDVSDRRHAEESLRQADRLASLGTLAAGIAHEINNPVGAILLAAESALSAKDRHDGSKRMTELLHQIRDDAERCGRIVTDVLKFSRQGTNKRELTSLNDVVRTTVDLTRKYVAERKATLTVNLSPKITPISMNAVEMEQVLVNLIRNAVEADSSSVNVTIRTQRTARSVQVSVRDNGRGMTEEQRALMFDPFFTTRQRDGGTGLGLSIVHGIVAMHGGSIEVKSRPSRGTTVHIRLPT